MRLYLSALSKNHLGYTPDNIIVENSGKRYEYSIFGTTDYYLENLETRTKGDLQKQNEEQDDYLDLTKEEENELLDLLNDPNSTVIVSIYPVPQCEDKEKELESDILTDCSGLLIIGEREASFKFSTEFYGI